ncbi:uncharacterized protein K460DRAFT_399180 [Cucurbitaria berberidis CBS 394.84]|uniref:Uncharacterized protein n=1 Tax=Cucurbitaria berberidis CBS 394.84 TaxID=1168544 RepID=A0A9P4G751_9PLEO|nr:uncharacterized protein K460DRAFT_399180 [Cucurbitaria berberidis CBS 394.84]KAF1840177.1 hypothetical protein K460DRAFT_399180 [Cucurbitaria berberidis CBS 394.84]
MANEKDVDPQWLWILPETFELTEFAKLQLSRGEAFDLGIEHSFIFHLNAIADLPHRKGSGCIFISSEEFKSAQAEYDSFQIVWKQCHDNIAQQPPKVSLASYIHYKHMLEALRYVGLDYRSSLIGFIAACVRFKRLYTQGMLVQDAEKARKYVNIGVHIGTDISEHPNTLKEAAVAFAKVSTLVSDLTDVETRESIIENCHNDKYRWALKREIFWIQTKERYRQALLDLAREECCEKELKGLREKKRARIDTA